MTEVDWLTETDLTAHLRFVADRLSTRRRRLLAVGFCRAAAHLRHHPDLAAALTAIERYADDPGAPGAVERVRQRCREIATAAYEEYRGAVDSAAARDELGASVRSQLAWAVAFAATDPVPLIDIGRLVMDTAAQLRAGAVRMIPGAAVPANLELSLVLRALIWDVAGNPSRPVHFSADWRTTTAVALARQMYATGEFGAMPILADALQDAGCDRDGVLTHCRDAPAAHARGCWVVDQVLGKT